MYSDDIGSDFHPGSLTMVDISFHSHVSSTDQSQFQATLQKGSTGKDTAQHQFSDGQKTPDSNSASDLWATANNSPASENKKTDEKISTNPESPPSKRGKIARTAWDVYDKGSNVLDGIAIYRAGVHATNRFIENLADPKVEKNIGTLWGEPTAIFAGETLPEFLSIDAIDTALTWVGDKVYNALPHYEPETDEKGGIGDKDGSMSGVSDAYRRGLGDTDNPFDVDNPISDQDEEDPMSGVSDAYRRGLGDTDNPFDVDDPFSDDSGRDVEGSGDSNRGSGEDHNTFCDNHGDDSW
jgi:hypothetical protein